MYINTKIQIKKWNLHLLTLSITTKYPFRMLFLGPSNIFVYFFILKMS